MRRTVLILTAAVLVAALAINVSAASTTGIQITASVSSDGSCQVTSTVTLHLETPLENTDFPLPLEARGITLNGSAVSTHKANGALQVDLSRAINGLTGNFTLTFRYTLPDCVTVDSLGRAIVQVPLLSGFAYPIDSMSFHITLPGETNAKPSFTSGYYQSSIESVLDSSISGQTVSGFSTGTLKDLETMSLQIEMPPEVFPSHHVETWSADGYDTAMYVLAGLSLLYWLVFLRCLPPRFMTCSRAPGSYTAGQTGSVLTGQGADLTMMVMSWAQLGYILIHVDHHNRVMLHKRMEMGNERSGLENRIFRALFGKKQMIDGTGYHYALLYKRVAALPSVFSDHYRHGSGNPLIFRLLACAASALSGVSLGAALGKAGFWLGFLIMVMVTFCTAASWLIQAGAAQLHLRQHKYVWIGLVCCLLRILFGYLAGDLLSAFLFVGFQLLAGLAAAYGGRRSSTGRTAVAELLGLRRYMKNAPKGEFQKISRSAPDYFFTLAPYAQAMGVGKRYAKQFGSMQLPDCPYLTTGMDAHRTASEWMLLMEMTAEMLDYRHERLLIERLLAR